MAVDQSPRDAEKERDVLEDLERALQEPMPREMQPDRAKLQLAVLYYVSKAVANAGAAKQLLELQHFYEACVLIRGLYNLVVDFLWLCQEPVARSRRFYDSTAVSLDTEYNRYLQIGVRLPDVAVAAAQRNRSHFDRVVDDFKDGKGRLRHEWAEGSIRSRAEALGCTDAELKPLGEWYQLLYKKLSDYEHSAPVLAFEYVCADERSIWAQPGRAMGEATARTFAELLGLLVGLVLRAGIQVGVLDRGRFAAG